MTNFARNTALGLVLSLTVATGVLAASAPVFAAETPARVQQVVTPDLDPMTTGTVQTQTDSACGNRLLSRDTANCGGAPALNRTPWPSAPINPAFGF